MAITVTTKDGKLHPYPTATTCVPSVDLGITCVHRIFDTTSVELVSWFPTTDIMKVEFFLRTEVAEAPVVDGMPVN